MLSNRFKISSISETSLHTLIMQLTTFSVLVSAASTLAMMTSQTKAAPLEARFCPEAARFGIFNVTAPSVVAYGDQLTVSYVQNCPDVQNIRPTSLTLDIGFESGGAFVQVGEPKPYFAGEKLEYTTTLPDFTLSNFVKGDRLLFLGTIQYTQIGPHGGEVDYLYTFEEPFTYDRPSNN